MTNLEQDGIFTVTTKKDLDYLQDLWRRYSSFGSCTAEARMLLGMIQTLHTYLAQKSTGLE
jgi:hypothetical protein